MTKDDIRKAVLKALADVAPEMDPSALDPAENLRDQLDIDSMDFLNYVIGLHQALNIEIPEADYPKLFTLEGAVAYAAEHLAATPSR